MNFYNIYQNFNHCTESRLCPAYPNLVTLWQLQNYVTLLVLDWEFLRIQHGYFKRKKEKKKKKKTKTR